MVGRTGDVAGGRRRRGAPRAVAAARCRPAAARLGGPAAAGRVQGLRRGAREGEEQLEWCWFGAEGGVPRRRRLWRPAGQRWRAGRRAARETGRGSVLVVQQDGRDELEAMASRRAPSGGHLAVAACADARGSGVRRRVAGRARDRFAASCLGAVQWAWVRRREPGRAVHSGGAAASVRRRNARTTRGAR
jgi:hypothetical protein